MVILKIKQNAMVAREDGAEDYLKNCIKYIKYDRDHARVGADGKVELPIRSDYICGHGFGVTYQDSKMCYEQMMTVKRMYGRERFNPVIHCIVSFNDIDDVGKCIEYCHGLERWIGMELRHQCVWALHRQWIMINNRYRDKRMVYHCHILINPVNYKTGLMMSVNRGLISRFVKMMNIMMDTYIEAYFDNTTSGQQFMIIGHRNRSKS
jgi:hypothetical protein